MQALITDMKKRIGLFFIVQRGLRQHTHSTLITMLSFAHRLGSSCRLSGLKCDPPRRSWAGLIGFDAVLGARGNPLQLVLNTVFHLVRKLG